MGKVKLDTLSGAIGGITGRDGRYPLKDRRREQGFDVDTEVDPEALEGTTEGAPKELSGTGEGQRNLTDPPGQAIADAPEDYEAPIEEYIPPEGVSSFQTPDHLVGQQIKPNTMPKGPKDEAVETVPVGKEAELDKQEPNPTDGDNSTPWNMFSRHEQLDKFIDDPDEGLSRPDNWMGMTVQQKKDWLGENA